MAVGSGGFASGPPTLLPAAPTARGNKSMGTGHGRSNDQKGDL
ncbi:hypothetical protein ACP70R_036492 [Stipagrostis hirtigluma subsp. patula]